MILELQRIGAPHVLMLCLLLLNFNQKVRRSPRLDFVEVWAGKAEVSKALRKAGLVGSALDILHSPLYDVCSVSGFLPLGMFSINIRVQLPVHACV